MNDICPLCGSSHTDVDNIEVNHYDANWDYKYTELQYYFHCLFCGYTKWLECEDELI